MTKSSTPPKTTLALVAALALAGRVTAEPQAVAQKPSFPAETEIVTVDVVVLSRAGEAVPDLRREDFTVSEDGVRQEIVAFEAVHRPAPPPAPRRPRPAAAREPALRASSNRGTPGRGPATFVIVFDELHLDPAEAERARRAVADFLGTGAADGRPRRARGHARRARAGRRACRRAARRSSRRSPGSRASGWARRCSDAMTEYEAMRIDQERDPIVTDQVTRRCLATGEIRRDVHDPAGRGARPRPRTSTAGAARRRPLAAQVYARAAMRSEQSLGHRRSGRSRRSREARGPQVAGARLRRASSRTRACAATAGRDRVAPREHRRLLPRRPRPGGRARPACRPTWPCRSTSSTAAPARGSTRRARRSEGSEGLALDTGGLRAQEPERPRRGPRPDRAASRAATTSLGYAPPNRRGRRALPRDRGEGRRART